MTPEALDKMLKTIPAGMENGPVSTPFGDEAPSWVLPAEPLSAPFPGYSAFESQPNLVGPEGNGSMGIAFMGEAPGEKEDYDRLPFRPSAQAGSVLQRAFSELGIDRASVTITNASWFRPPRNWLEGADWESRYVQDGRRRNVQLFQERRPTVIVALGKIAFHELTGLYGVNIEQGRGFVVPARKEYGGIPIIGTYHPSFIIRGAKRKSTDTGAMTEKQSGGGWSFYSVLKRDIALGLARLRDAFLKTDFNSKGFNRYGSREDWEHVIQVATGHLEYPISYDFETPLSVVQGDESEFERAMGNITQFQVSLYPGHALVSSWDYSLFPLIKKLMELPNVKLDWNGRGFDRDILRNLGIKFTGEYHDLMRTWTHWQRDLPRGLQFATSFVSPEDGPWKHTFDSDLRSYGIRDVHEPQKIWEFLKREMRHIKAPGGWDLWRGYQRQVYELHAKVLDPLQTIGIPINNQRRTEMSECLLNLSELVSEEVNQLVPEHLKPTKQADGLKDVPKDLVERKKPELEAMATEAAIAEANGKKVTKKRISEIYKERLNAWKVSLPDRVEHESKIFVRRLFPILDDLRRVVAHEKRWAELEPFNSNSSMQLMDYIRWRHQDEVASLGPNPSKSALNKIKWKIPIDFKTKKPTTAKKELDRLGEKTNDPVIKLVIEDRELTKMRSTYVEGWAPGLDGRVHPFYDDNTGTGQLTAVNPAALTFPKHLKRQIHFSAGVDVAKVRGCRHDWKETSPGGYLCSLCGIPSKRYELGKLVRTMIEPRPGYRIIEADYKAFHVLTTGYEAQDPKYMRLARLDMHSFIAATQLLRLADSHELLAMPDSELMKVLKGFRRDETPRYHGPGGILVPFEYVRGKQAKPAILGYGFGMQPSRFYHENQEFLPHRNYAFEVFAGLDREFPICCAWRKQIVQFADRQGGYLVSKHGYIRRFNCCVDKFPVDNDYVARPGDTIRIGRDGTKWCFSAGDDGEAIIAFLPANDAFGMIKECMLRMEAMGLLEKYGLIIPIHDALVFECREEYVDEALPVIKREMERPSEVLILPDGTGLWCEAELSINKPGLSWAEMDEVKL